MSLRDSTSDGIITPPHQGGFLESIFCLLLVVETFSLQKLARCLKKWLLVGKGSGEYSASVGAERPSL